MWNKFRQIGKSRHLQGPHVVEGQNANLLQGPFRKEWRNRPKVDVGKPLFPEIREILREINFDKFECTNTVMYFIRFDLCRTDMSVPIKTINQTKMYFQFCLKNRVILIRWPNDHFGQN